MLAGVTLLDEVIQGASGTTPVAVLLRQVKVLSARTQTAGLAAWVNHELNGYSDDVDVPHYRGPFTILPLGHFVGPFGSEARNVQIPPSTFPAELRDGSLFKVIYDQSIVQLEEWAKSEHTNFSWPADAVPMYHHLLRTGEVSSVMQPMMVLAEVHYTLPATTFLGIMDTVRNKVLDLALELEQVAPLAGQPDTPAEQQAPAAAVIHNHFHAASNVAIGSPGTSQVVVGIPVADDVDALLRYLGGAGLPPVQLHELADAIAADQAEDHRSDEQHEQKTRWSRTSAWLTRAATDTGTGALGGAIATAAAGFLGG